MTTQRVRPGAGVPPESERSFQAAVVELAKRLGWKLHYVYDSRRSPDGWPDLFMVRGQRAIAAELKTDTGTVGREQWVWQEVLAQVPGIDCYIWRPSQKAEIAAVLR